MKLEVRESQIEDVLVNASALTRRLLNLKDEPRLLARQMILPSGRLDLLYAYQAKLLLVELKAVEFRVGFLDQVLSYKADLVEHQRKKSCCMATLIHTYYVRKLLHRKNL